MLNNLALFHVCVWWGWKIVEEQYAIMQLQKNIAAGICNCIV